VPSGVTLGITHSASTLHLLVCFCVGLRSNSDYLCIRYYISGCV